MNIYNSDFIDNFGLNNGIIISKQISKFNFYNCTFENNYSLGRGSVAFANRDSELEFRNCRFKNNYSLLGGVGYGHLDSKMSFIECVF